MNPIPDDDELEDFVNWMIAMGKFQKASDLKWYDSNGNEIFPEESELERLDKKYAPLFEKLEGKE